ncbi:MAG: Rab family GTPase [Promethearchaeati archaeon SRVP18_Atabeyarchaeia-1]
MPKKNEQYEVEFPISKGPHFKIVVLGEPAVGKTTLVRNFTHKELRDEYLPTIGVEITTKRIDVRGTQVTLIMWDLAGQPQFKIIRPMYYKGSAGAVFMFDVTMPHTLARVDDWVGECASATSGIPGVLIGNKIDLTDRRLVDRSTAEARASRLGLKYFETSAKLGQNIEAALMWLLAEILKSQRGSG